MESALKTEDDFLEFAAESLKRLSPPPAEVPVTGTRPENSPTDPPVRDLLFNQSINQSALFRTGHIITRNIIA